MEELWRSSQDPDNWGLFKPPSYILYWWLLWIGFFIFVGETRVFSLSLALTHTGIGIIITKIVLKKKHTIHTATLVLILRIYLKIY